MASREVPISETDSSAELMDWTVSDDMPGYKLSLGSGKYIIAQLLGNGPMIAWSARVSAGEAIEQAIASGDSVEGLNAIIRHGQRGELSAVGGVNILRAIHEHDDTWWVRLGSSSYEDYTVYATDKGGSFTEMAVIGRAQNRDGAELFLNPLSLMETTGIPDVQLMGAYVMKRILPLIDPQQQAA